MDTKCVPSLKDVLIVVLEQMPRKGGNEHEKANRSIAAYIERSSHFFALCPSVKSQDDDDVTCDYGSWLQNSGNRFELFALLLSRHDRPPPIVSDVQTCAKQSNRDRWLRVGVWIAGHKRRRFNPVHGFAFNTKIARHRPDGLL